MADAGRWGEGVPPPRSRRPGPLRVNAALPQAKAASHPFSAQSVLLTCPQLRFPGPLGRADVQEPHYLPWATEVD